LIESPHGLRFLNFPALLAKTGVRFFAAGSQYPRDIRRTPTHPPIVTGGAVDEDGVADDVLFDRRGDCAAVEKL
jgi:hypothetical protein